MKALDVLELVALAAIWGASFLFMRQAAPEFGPIALTALRVAGAALFLLPLLAWRGAGGALRAHWKPIAAVGLANSALPFTLFTIAALAINAGLSAILNSTAPLWAAAIAALWLVSCRRNTFCDFLDFLQYRVRGGDPLERCGVGVVALDE